MTVKEYEGHRIDIKRGDKVLFPNSEISKRDLVDYYSRIAPQMLPHMEERPLTLRRFPDGIEKCGFFQKEAPDYYPDWIERIWVNTAKGGQDMVNGNSVGTLAYVANQGTVELHIGLSRLPDLDFPDQIIFDLDPPGRGDFEVVRRAAQHTHALCEELHLPSFLKTTGSKGLHVVIPIEPEYSFDVVRNFARNFAQILVDRYPDLYTLEHRINKRGGKLYLDVLRNGTGQTAIAPYSVRALPGAPIATPLDWNELSGKGLKSDSYNLGNIFRRLSQKDDPWDDFQRQSILLSDHLDQLH